MSVPCLFKFLLVISLLAPSMAVGQQVIDSCFTSISVGTTFGSSANIANRNADCLNWTGSTWTGDWPGANVNLAPPGSTPGTRAIWMGDASVWTTGGEGFGMRLNGPIVNGTTYNFEFTRVSHGMGSGGNFAPTLFTNTTGTMGTTVGAIPGVGNSWTTGIVSFTATAANNGHTFIFFLSQGGGGGSGMFLACGNAVVLPMELRRLDGWAESEANQLAWEMYNEVGYSRHVIERSKDGQAFQEVGQLASSGAAESTQYSFADTEVEALAPGRLFYRVRSELLDGEEALSPVVEIHRQGQASYLHKLWPNPVAAGAELHLEMVAAQAGKGQLRIIDLLGCTVQEMAVDLEGGMNELEVSLLQEKPGFYFVEIRTSSTVLAERFLLE